MIADSQHYIYISSLILASIISGFLTSILSILIAKKLDIIDYPVKSSHHIHKFPTPRAGGIAIILSFIILLTVFSLWDVSEIISIILPALVIFAFGLWDDRFGMNAQTKLLGQIIAVTILVSFGVRIQFLENQSFFFILSEPVALALDLLLTYFWMIGITNAFNMVDSMDGQAIGLIRIASIFFMFLTLVSNQPALVYLTAILFGISWGIAFFNIEPAKTFLGDSGAQTFGFILAAIAILHHPLAYGQSSSWFAPILFFSVPIFDTTLVTISRFRRKIPFYKANRDHTYHRLIEFGWNSSNAVTIIHTVSLLFSLCAFIATYLKPIYANAIFIAWLLLFGAMIIFMEYKFIKKTNSNL